MASQFWHFYWPFGWRSILIIVRKSWVYLRFIHFSDYTCINFDTYLLLNSAKLFSNVFIVSIFRSRHHNCHILNYLRLNTISLHLEALVHKMCLLRETHSIICEVILNYMLWHLMNYHVGWWSCQLFSHRLPKYLTNKNTGFVKHVSNLLILQ